MELEDFQTRSMTSGAIDEPLVLVQEVQQVVDVVDEVVDEDDDDEAQARSILRLKAVLKSMINLRKLVESMETKRQVCAVEEMSEQGRGSGFESRSKQL